METSTLLNSRYQIVQKLGDGGFGQTFLVEDVQMPSGRKCVLKQLKPTDNDPQIQQMVQERFQREAAILERLGDGHEQIPSLYAYFTEGDRFYLVEEWVEGETLTQKVQQQGSLSEATVRSLLMNLLPAIAYVHNQQLIHRDIKPDNIVLRRTDFRPMLIDFGAVKETMTTAINSQGHSTHSIVVGTPGYMPSEQMTGRPVFASDLYSLGLTAIYLLTGKQPHELDSDPRTGSILWRNYAPNVSTEFANLLDKTIQLNANQRFATAQEMLTALSAGMIEAVSPTPAHHNVQAFQSPAMPSAPTIVSSPQYSSGAQTQVAIPQPVQSQPIQMPIYQQSVNTGGEWKKAVLIGCIIGASILGGALLLRPQSSGTSTASSAAPSPASSPAPSPTTSTLPASPTAVQPPVTQQAPAATQFTSPAVQSLPTSPSSIGIVTEPPAASPDVPAAPSPASDNTNATIVSTTSGQKNIRSGPGTRFGIQHVAYPGDRVRILETSQDVGGYTWHKVYFPKTGANGWIAAQLIQRD
jgi:serine/threonine protein kinase, bacterial